MFLDPLESFDLEFNTDIPFLTDFQFFGFADLFPYFVPMFGGILFIFFDETDLFEEDLEELSELIADDLSDDLEDDFESEQVDSLSSSNFVGIAFCNLLGMLPFSSGLGGSLFLIFFFSLFSLLIINLFGWLKHKIRFFSLFLPEGTPLLMAPFIIVIEFISYLARVFSLSIRLFANLMSGHTLLKILSTFTWVLLLFGGIIFFVSFFPLLLISIIFCLETIIAILQAYVYTLLLCIYTNDVYKLH